MRIVTVNTPEKTFDEVVGEINPFLLEGLLVGSGVALGTTFLENKFDPNFNYELLDAVIRISGSNLNHQNSVQEISLSELSDLSKVVLAIKNVSRSEPPYSKHTIEELFNYLIKMDLYHSKFQDYVMHTIPRIFILVNELKYEWDKYGINILEKFVEKFGVDFETFSILIYGTVALQRQNITAFPGMDFDNFFNATSATFRSNIPRLKKVYDELLSFDFEGFRSAMQKEEHIIECEDDLFSKISPLEKKPFVKFADGKYILPIPHFFINSFRDHFYNILNEEEVTERLGRGSAKPYSTIFSSSFGKVLEKYVALILSDIDKNFELEPIYKDKKNEVGPDIVLLSSKIIIEITKMTPDKTLRLNFNRTDLVAMYEAVASKFEQSFKWFSSYGLIYKNIYANNVTFIVVTAEYIPGLQFNYSRSLFYEILDERWSKYSNKKRPRCFVISLSEFETLLSVMFYEKVSFNSVLNQYFYYLKYQNDVGKFKVKSSLKNFLLEQYDLRGKLLPRLKDIHMQLIQDASGKMFDKSLE